ncbi:MAG: hypothetical protein PVH77_02020 [Phycisphaerales bacterium]|jgi:hypothetical protein
MSRVCFVFVIFCFTAVLVFAVYLRSANDRVFYELCTSRAMQNRLKQELGTKQLIVEGMINPAAVSQRFERLNTND